MWDCWLYWGIRKEQVLGGVIFAYTRYKPTSIHKVRLRNSIMSLSLH